MANLKNTTINDTGYIQLPVGTTAQRPVSPTVGMIRYNTTTKNYEGYAEGQWINITSPVADIVTANLTLYYDYGNTSCYSGSGTSVNDLSTGNNDGTLTGGVSYSSSNSGIMNFTGSGSYISTSYQVPGTARSHFYWVKFSTLNHASGYQLSGTQQSGAYTYIGIQNGGQIYFYIGSSTGGAIGTTLSANTWYQLGQVIDSSGQVAIYLNGNSVYTTTASLGSTASSLFQVGAINNNHHVTGSMGIITVYNTNLSAAQITQNYDAAKNRYGL